MVNYIPIVTTFFALVFFRHLALHAKAKPEAKYLLWWAIGIATYGLGTLTESIHAIAGWRDWNFKAWYILGALLGGAPLAQGPVYLLVNKRFGDLSSAALVLVVLAASTAVLLSPLQLDGTFDGRLSGQVFDWQWVRRFSPFINSYAFIFLFGGAIYSAIKYARLGKSNKRFLGNIYIAVGALLPGIGGSFTRFGYVEVLYVTELLGLLFMYLGYQVMQKDSATSVHAEQLAVQEVR